MKPTMGRYLASIAILLLVFVAIFDKLYDLQIASGETYSQQAANRTTRTISLTGMRGTIYDANMIPLAYDKRSYNVQFYRDPTLASDGDRAEYTRAIIETIRLVESNGKKIITGFWLERDEEGNWRFNTGTENEAAAAKREQQWRENFYLTKVPTEQLFDTLCENYAIPDQLTEQEKIKVLTIWQQSRMYNFLSQPVTIAYNVNFETVSEIEVRSNDLPGISIAEGSTRIYPKKTLAAHTIGYISKISSDEALAVYKEKGYANDALVGQTGIEYSMEDQLTPHIAYRQGKRTVEVNNRGKVIREISYEAPMDGNDVILTIDNQLQAIMEDSLQRNIEAIREEQTALIQTDRWRKNNREVLEEYEEAEQEIQLAQTGAMIAIDPHSGKVLAMASNPGYDLSMFSDEVDSALWNELVGDTRNPLYNRVVSARDTPGSIFKMVTALGALMEGDLTLDERISDEGPFKGTDASYQPRCWISASKRYQHANQTVVEGIKNSCNFFFFTIGNRMGSEKLTKWAAQLGLTSRTGIEVPNESSSFVGNQLMLYDSGRAISDQYTSKPIYSAYMAKKALKRIGEERGIQYDDERLDVVTKKLLDIVNEEGMKDTWPAKIQRILLEDMNLPSRYIQNNFLVNEFYYYINDLRWTSNETIMASIGQSITQVTPIAVARYVAAICNGGSVYDAHVIDKVVSPTGNVILEKQPQLVNRITGAGSYLAAIQEGMKEVTSVENDGTAASYFSKARYKIAAKTGTAQRTDLDVENNSWLVTYAPYDSEPEIVVVSYIQNGYAGAKSAKGVIRTIEYYLDSLKNTDTATVANTGRLSE
jgi:penicillin-binding protein 2